MNERIADPVPDLLRVAALAVLDGRIAEAGEAINAIDKVGLLGGRAAAHEPVWGPGGIARSLVRPTSRGRVEARRSEKLATFRRDRFVCRYEHCRRRTIALPVLKALSRALPDALPYHPNWKRVSDHVIYWLYATSLEHRVGFLHGGSSHPSNLITACYGCNDLKSWLRAEDLGWRVVDTAAADWDGLESLIPALRQLGLARPQDW